MRKVVEKVAAHDALAIDNVNAVDFNPEDAFAGFRGREVTTRRPPRASVSRSSDAATRFSSTM
jgi:hypothetical protein